ncbi:MAG: anthranilate phosphoribosyltransferase family protein [Cyanothece sp. SIO2G6]|nr:anthranilate phosphoribosyltransferase family protein [Cyanothece sp. SIO2G6]
MSDEFRDLLRKVGSGTHTSKALTREESARAAHLMLTQTATPAQIGAFMIAHRIKRPTGEELTGFLDAYNALGPRLKPVSGDRTPLVLNSPYDGRSRTAPIRPLTTLILAAAGCPVISHGGDRTPTKYGIPLSQIWQSLGCDWSTLTLEQVQHVFEQTHIAFVYTPTLFPLAHDLVPYREQIGKRPPLATIELIWCPYGGEALIAVGFVHPPTEQTAQYALNCHQTRRFIMVKGLEGSCDLPRDRTCIMGMGPGKPDTNGLPTVDRFFLRPKDYAFNHSDVVLEDEAKYLLQLEAILAREGSQESTEQLQKSVLWNSGFYLWQSGCCDDMGTGLALAHSLLSDGSALKKLKELQGAIASRLG